MAIRILSSENITGNITLHHPSNAPYIDFVENSDTSDSKAKITMDQVDTNNGTLLFATENAGTLYNQVKITQTGNLLLSNDAASFNTSNAKLNVLPASSGVYQQWNYSPSNENFSLKLKETVTSGNVRYVFEQINNSTTYPNILVFNSGKVGIGTDEPSEKLNVVGTSGNTNIRVYDSSANSEVGLKLEGDAKTWTLQNWGSGGDNLRLLNNAGDTVQLWDDNGRVAIGNFNDPDRTLDVRGDGMSIYGTGDYTELMLRGQVEGTGTVRNVGSWHWSVRPDVGGDNDDLKLLRFVTGTFSGTAMQIQNSTGNVGIGTSSPRAVGSGYKGLEVSSPSSGSSLWLSGFSDTTKGYLAMDTGGLNLTAISTHSLTFGTNNSPRMTILSGGNVGIGTTSPSQKLDVQGNVNINGTIVEEGSGNNKTFRYRTPNSSSHAGGNALITFGRFYWTPAHWVSDGPVLEVTLQCKYYLGEQRKYIITAGYGDNEVIVNELQPSTSDQKITLQIGTKTAAGYDYAGQPVYYVDLQWTQTAYIWGWAQLSQQVSFLTANPTSGWGGVVVYSALGQNNNAGTPQNYGSFFNGDIGAGGQNKARFKSDGTNTYVDAIPANSEIRFRVAGAVEKFRIAASGATTQTMDSTTSLSHLWSQGVPLQNTWYTVYTYSQYDSVCFFAMVSFENDAGDGANQSAMFATSAGAAYGAAFGVQQISGGTGIEARRSSTSFQVRQTIGGYTSATRLNVRFVSIN